VTGNVDCGFGYVSCLASQFVEYTSEIGCRLYSCTWLFHRRHPIYTHTVTSFIVLSLTFCVCNIWIFVSNFHSSVTRVVHCLSLARQPPVGQGLLIPEVPRSHTTTYHIRQDYLDEWSAWRRDLCRQHTTLTTNIHASSGIGTHSLSRRAAADRRLIPLGHWDRRSTILRW
jgi:hypothetical protein